MKISKIEKGERLSKSSWPVKPLKVLRGRSRLEEKYKKSGMCGRRVVVLSKGRIGSAVFDESEW
jgi:hypothetical protein